MAESTFHILNKVDITLQHAENGYQLVVLGMTSQGMKDLIVYGRSVTFVLQNLRKTEPDFDVWYQPFYKEMESDEMMKFFNKLRSKILKEGEVPVTIEMGFPAIDIKEIKKQHPKPENATRLVIGSNNSGSYWEIKNPDGSLEKRRIDVSFQPILIQRFKNGPKEHLGENIEGETVEQMAKRYLKYLRNVVSEAHRRFDRMKSL